jgi:hypothetical protein
MADHLNNIERVLIDNLRNKAEEAGHPWGLGEVTVFGQFPETEDVKYPCVVVEMVANGIEEQFLGQKIEGVTGEIYGIAFNIHVACDINSTLSTGDGTGFKQRRLINYMMLNVANILMDCDFIGATPSTEVTSRYHTGFREVNYNPDLETWAATTSMVIVFLNKRS